MVDVHVPGNAACLLSGPLLPVLPVYKSKRYFFLDSVALPTSRWSKMVCSTLIGVMGNEPCAVCGGYIS